MSHDAFQCNNYTSLQFLHGILKLSIGATGHGHSYPFYSFPISDFAIFFINHSISILRLETFSSYSYHKHCRTDEDPLGRKIFFIFRPLFPVTYVCVRRRRTHAIKSCRCARTQLTRMPSAFERFSSGWLSQ